MQLGFARRLHAFQHLLHQVNTTTRAVKLVAQQLVGGASGRAKAAMHTFAQNGFSGVTVWRVFKFWGEVGLHNGICKVYRLHIRKHAATIENAGGVELLLQITVDTI